MNHLTMEDLRYLSMLLGVLYFSDEEDERAEEVLDKVNEEIRDIKEKEREEAQVVDLDATTVTAVDGKIERYTEDVKCEKCGYYKVDTGNNVLRRYVCPRCEMWRTRWQ